ncbi:hypothetical protein SHAb15599_00123 [Acinetobacter phage SH-Ab 15599]|nr:hypothetical protein SHAb15599_00123 [Acinetobacter phage SH-Ab 15599]
MKILGALDVMKNATANETFLLNFGAVGLDKCLKNKGETFFLEAKYETELPNPISYSCNLIMFVMSGSIIMHKYNSIDALQFDDTSDKNVRFIEEPVNPDMSPKRDLAVLNAPSHWEISESEVWEVGSWHFLNKFDFHSFRMSKGTKILCITDDFNIVPTDALFKVGRGGEPIIPNDKSFLNKHFAPPQQPRANFTVDKTSKHSEDAALFSSDSSLPKAGSAPTKK